MRYYIADCHFFHRDLLDAMDRRNFGSVEEMNDYMIARWNAKVRPRDEVVILGDFSMGNAAQTTEIVAQLHGKLHLIIGNHDNRFLRSKQFDRERFVWIHPYAEMHDEGRKVVLCHYPMPCYNGQYLKNKQGEPKTFMLYGHVHDTHDARLMEQFGQQMRKTMVTGKDGAPFSLACNMINCFCMYSDYEPLSLDEWIARTPMIRYNNRMGNEYDPKERD